MTELVLPDGGKIGLSARQAATAEIKPHSNHGRSTIRFTLEVEIQAAGDEAANKRAIKHGLLGEVEALGKLLEESKDEARGLRKKLAEMKETDGDAKDNAPEKTA